MAKTRVTWTDHKLNEDGVKIYRSNSPIDPGSLPAPLAEVPVGRGVYEDKTATAGATQHYHVAPFAGGTVGEGAAAQATSAEALPRFLYSTPYAVVDSATSITVPIPDCKPGDLLVAVGFRRSALTPPAGWTSGGTPPDGTTGTGLAQWTYAYYKTAVAGDAGQNLTFTQAAAGRMGLMILVFRHSSKAIVVSNLGAIRQPQQALTGNAMTAANGNYKSLYLNVFSWTLQLIGASDEVWIGNWSTRFFPVVNPRWFQNGPEGGLRYMAFLTEANENENVSLTIGTSAQSADAGERVSFIALAIRT